VIKRYAAAVFCLAALFVLPGCSNILEGDTLVVTMHEKPVSVSPDSEIQAGNYDELKTRILEFIKERQEIGFIRVNTYDGDIQNLQNDVNRACSEITKDDPYGAFAVLSMTGTVNKIVSYYQVDININYKDVTKEQLDSIVPVSTIRYLESILKDKLSNYEQSLTVLAMNLGLTRDMAAGMVQQFYYEHPMDIVMMPVLTVDQYPEHGPNQIIEFSFAYRYEPSMLAALEEALRNTVRNIAGSVSGPSDGELLLSLCESLMEITEFDAATAGRGDYSTQNKSATAYGALVEGSAVGEGYAMAYKALCDELSIESYVVLGERDGDRHAWNIVNIDDHYYHIDVSMCDVNGIETAFLKSDAEMKKNYRWDTNKYKPCNGPLTYGDLLKAAASPQASPQDPPADSAPTT